MAEGPNLVTNGDFPSTVGDWTKETTGLADFLWSSNGGGQAVVSAFSNFQTSPVGFVRAYQEVTVTAFTDYKATWDIKIAGRDEIGEITYGARGFVGLSIGENEHADILATSTGVKTAEFTTGSEISVFITFFCLVASGAFNGGNSFNFDDVTLREQLSGLFSPRIIVL